MLIFITCFMTPSIIMPSQTISHEMHHIASTFSHAVWLQNMQHLFQWSRTALPAAGLCFNESVGIHHHVTNKHKASLVFRPEGGDTGRLLVQCFLRYYCNLTWLLECFTYPWDILHVCLAHSLWINVWEGEASCVVFHIQQQQQRQQPGSPRGRRKPSVLIFTHLMRKWCPVQLWLVPLQNTHCGLSAFTSFYFFFCSGWKSIGQYVLFFFCFFLGWLYKVSFLECQQCRRPQMVIA